MATEHPRPKDPREGSGGQTMRGFYESGYILEPYNPPGSNDSMEHSEQPALPDHPDPAPPQEVTEGEHS